MFATLKRTQTSVQTVTYVGTGNKDVWPADLVEGRERAQARQQSHDSATLVAPVDRCQSQIAIRCRKQKKGLTMSISFALSRASSRSRDGRITATTFNDDDDDDDGGLCVVGRFRSRTTR